MNLSNWYDGYVSRVNETGSTPTDYYKNNLQQLINERFNIASDVYTIQEEQHIGDLDWQDIIVRLCHVLSDKQTGEKLGDDFKEIIFKDINHAYGVGKRYSFDNNVWITMNSDLYHYVTASCIIRRCNNVLRWIDEFGNHIEEPCIIEYQLRLTGNDFNSNIITPNGMLEVICQYNDKTKKIIPNQRFLFGSPRVAYKVRGNGINNFLNQNTYDDSSSPLIKLYMDVNQINNATDNITDGYADAYQNNYTISIDQGLTLEQNVGYISTLNGTLKLNGVVVTGLPLVWSSSDPSIVSISPQNGNFMLNQTGSAVVTVALENNPSVNCSINITVDAVIVDNYEVRIDNVTEILQGQSNSYKCYLYKNNVVQLDTFTFNISGSVPTSKYKFTIIDGNDFKVDNLQMYSASPLIINCVSGIYSGSISIMLKGAW